MTVANKLLLIVIGRTELDYQLKMKSKLLSIFAVGLVASTAVFTSCNDDDSGEAEEIVYGSTQVKSFKLKADAKVLSGLDSVFFSIDLVNAQIFNADSLPYGTRTNKLVLQISTDACSKVELNVPRKNGSDTVINYLTNSTDSVDFSNGPVRLHLVSFDGKAERDYTIKVNVHNMVPDSLYWNELAMHRLPANIAAPKQQKTVRTGDKVVCLTSDGSRYNIATTDNPFDDKWQVKSVDFGFTPEVSSLSATSDALYILAADGTLYTSADGSAWTSTSQQWHSILGGYGETLLGVKATADGYSQVAYPAGTEAAAPADFPVEASSALSELTSKWAVNPQVVMLGGRKADGELTNAVWGYDGKNWTKISSKFPKAVANAAMFDYRMAQTDTLSWQTREVAVLIAMCGEEAEGLNGKVYVSRNAGLDWKEGDELVQLPTYITPRTDAQAIVVNHTATVSRASSAQWKEYSAKPLPRWWQAAPALIMPASRAVAPVTEWEVPYIYLFGGYDADGYLCNTVWRGVINRLSFKPLQ